MTKEREYSEKDVTGFKRDLEKVQARPNMFIGPTDGSGIYTILREACDNAVDEARAGRNTLVAVIYDADGYFWVIDNGVGIPVKPHPVMKISTLTHVLTNLQSSGKMQSKAYKHSIGTHGVGIKATNALSTEFDVWTYRQDAGESWYHTRFEKGIETAAVAKCKPPKTPAGVPKRGTVIRFKPSKKYFGDHKISFNQVALWAEMTSYMNSGLRIVLQVKGKKKEWHVKDGIKAYLAKRVADLDATLFSKKTITINSETMELALTFTDLEGTNVEFFTNTVRNVDGGVHADDVYRALFDSLKPFMKIKEKKKKKNKGESKWPFTPADLTDGLLGLVNYKIDAPIFSGQTKEKLVDGRVKGVCHAEALDVFAKFWKDNQKLAKDMILRATELRNTTADFLKDKKLLKNVGAARKAISSKLAGVVGRTPVEERELFVVEGDSAGGGCAKFNTQVLLADGTTKSMAQLVADDSIGIKNIGVAFDLSNRQKVDIVIDSPRVTKMVKEMVLLVFDNGTTEEFTPDHLFLLKDGTYKAAIDISPEDDLQEVLRV
jgi:DNA gyrase subunit B